MTLRGAVIIGTIFHDSGGSGEDTTIRAKKGMGRAKKALPAQYACNIQCDDGHVQRICATGPICKRLGGMVTKWVYEFTGEFNKDGLFEVTEVRRI